MLQLKGKQQIMNKLIQLDEKDSETINRSIERYKLLSSENQERFKKGVITEREYVLKDAKLIQEQIEYIGSYMFDKLMINADIS